MTLAATLVDVEETEPTPEPVFRWTLIVPVISALWLATLGVVRAFDLWNPTEEQVAAIAAFGSPLVLALGVYTSWQARKRVTPTEKVALTNSDVELLDAAQGPPMFISPAKGDHGV